jgi:hypothetical protein
MSTILIVIIAMVALVLLALLVFGGKRKSQTKADKHLEAASDAAGRAERERVVAEHHRERARESTPA